MTPAQLTAWRTRMGHRIEYSVNGWTIEERPNSFAERYAWEATSINGDGYLTARQGFNTLREAKKYCEAHNVP